MDDAHKIGAQVGAWQTPDIDAKADIVAAPQKAQESSEIANLLSAINYDKIQKDTLDKALDLLKTRNQLEFDRFQRIEIKGVALLAGLFALFGVMISANSSWIEHLIALFLFVPMGCVGWMLYARRFDFAPSPRSILTGLSTAADFSNDEQYSKALSGSVQTFAKAIQWNYTLNARKAKWVNWALLTTAAIVVVTAWLSVAGFGARFQPPQAPLATSRPTVPNLSSPSRPQLKPSKTPSKSHRPASLNSHS